MIPGQPLLLFDLDGTLLLTVGAGARAMDRAGKRVWGEAFSIASVNFAGSLDPVVVQEATRAARIVLDTAAHTRFRSLYASELREELLRPESQAFALPGVLSLLEGLRSSGNASLGLLTGNYEETGSLKLEAVGIDPTWFSPRVWGDAAPTRPDLVRHAMQLTGHPPDAVIVVGDTPKDVHCAKVNGCRVLAVATGSCTKRELLEAGADHAVDSLDDPSPLLAMLAGTSP